MIESIDGFKIENREFPFSERSLDEIRHEIWEVTKFSDEIGGIFYPGKDNTKTLVIFAGYMEKFAMLSLARHVWCNILILQDVFSPWYQGSSLLPTIAVISKTIEKELVGQRLYLFGQASGAYAALVASRDLQNARVVAVSPHTFSDGSVKQRIKFGAKLAPCVTPDGLIDLRDYLTGADTSTDRVIFCSSSEVDNPSEAYFWVDHLHSLRLVNLRAVRIFMARSTSHSFVAQKAAVFAQLLSAAIHSRDAWEAVVERALFNMSEQDSRAATVFP